MQEIGNRPKALDNATSKRNVPFDPSSWATGRVGNFGARWAISWSTAAAISKSPHTDPCLRVVVVSAVMNWSLVSPAGNRPSFVRIPPTSCRM